MCLAHTQEAGCPRKEWVKRSSVNRSRTLIDTIDTDLSNGPHKLIEIIILCQQEERDLFMQTADGGIEIEQHTPTPIFSSSVIPLAGPPPLFTVVLLAFTMHGPP